MQKLRTLSRNKNGLRTAIGGVAIAFFLAAQSPCLAANWQIQQNSEIAGQYVINVEKQYFRFHFKERNMDLFGDRLGNLIWIFPEKKQFYKERIEKFQGHAHEKVMQITVRNFEDARLIKKSAAKFRTFPALEIKALDQASNDDPSCVIRTICLNDDTIAAVGKIVSKMSLIPAYREIPLRSERLDGFPTPMLVTGILKSYAKDQLQTPALTGMTQTPTFTIETDDNMVKDIFGK
jgi:hypothetical protein